MARSVGMQPLRGTRVRVPRCARPEHHGQHRAVQRAMKENHTARESEFPPLYCVHGQLYSLVHPIIPRARHGCIHLVRSTAWASHPLTTHAALHPLQRSMRNNLTKDCQLHLLLLAKSPAGQRVAKESYQGHTYLYILR